MSGSGADRGRMRLGAYFNPTGHHVASWRHPRAQTDAHINIKHYVEIAQTAERAKFDMIFLADSRRGPAGRHRGADAARCSSSRNFEPITLLSAIAMVTEHDRPGRDGIDQLQRALSRRAQVRLARPHQRRPRGLERRHVRLSGRGA